MKAGATATMPVADMFWGDRYGIVTDPFGHAWSIATHQKDMSVGEIQEALKAMGNQPCPDAAQALAEGRRNNARDTERHDRRQETRKRPARMPAFFADASR